MTDVQQQILIGIAAGAPFLAFVSSYCFGRALSPSRMHWSAIASAAMVLAASVTAALLLRDSVILPADSMVRYCWLTLPGNLEPIEMVWQFDAVSAIFLIAVSTATLCTLWIRADAISSGDDSSRLRILIVAPFLQFAIVMLLLSRDWLSFFCSWQLITAAISRVDGRSSTATHNRNNCGLDSTLQSIAAAVMLFGVMLYWQRFRSFEFSAITAASGMRPDSSPEIWVAGLCFFVAASARCSLFPFPVIRLDGRETGTHDRQFMLSVFSVPMAVLLIVRALPLLQSSATLMTVVMGLGAVTALLGAFRGAIEIGTERRLCACESSLIGLVILGLGTFTPTAIVSALLLMVGQIVAMTALRLVSITGRQESAIQGRWGYLVSAIILGPGFWGQQMVLAEVAQRIREVQSPLQGQILLVIYWGAVASLPCLSFALARGYFELGHHAVARTVNVNSRGKFVLWLLPMAAIAILLFVLDQPGRLIILEGQPLNGEVGIGVTSPLEFDVGLPLVFLGVVVAWLYKSTSDSSSQLPQFHLHGLANWIRNGLGTGRLWDILVGGPLSVLATCCRVIDDCLLGTGGRALIRRTLNLSADVSCELQTGRVQFYLLSLLLVTAFLLLLLQGWGM